MKSIYVSRTKYGVDCLETMLSEGHKPELVFALKDDYKKVILDFGDFDEVCGRENIRLEKLDDIRFHKQIFSKNYIPNFLRDNNRLMKGYNPRIAWLMGFGEILKGDTLEIPSEGWVGIHPTLLPKYRGASPIQQSILNGDKFSGVTAMMMDVGLDSGDILALKYLELKPTTSVSELFDQLSLLAADLTIEVLNRFDKITPKKQNLSLVSHCGKINKTDGLVQFDNANLFYKKYKAYKNWPDIYLESGIKIKECEIFETNNINNSSEILKIDTEYIVVGCNLGSIKITQVQPSSKKEMNVIDYIRGKRLNIGDNFS